jgi:hypothetical protein
MKEVNAMNKRHLSPHFFCPLASELGIPKICIRNQACQHCAFAEWLDDTRSECALLPALEAPEAFAASA